MGDRGNEWQGGENEIRGRETERERKRSWWRGWRKERKTTWGGGRRGREKLENEKEKI